MRPKKEYIFELFHEEILIKSTKRNFNVILCIVLFCQCKLTGTLQEVNVS